MNWKGGLGDLLTQASQMREQVQQLQEQMAKRTVEATVGGGMVRVVCNGKQQVLSLTIDPQVMTDPQMLQDLVMAGVNQAIRASQEMMSEEMSKIMGGWGPLASLLKPS